MNILYILGNGFDLAQGMETSYADFYNYLGTAIIKDATLKRMVEEIKADVVDWSDMELSMGRFSSQIKTPEEFMSMFDELNDHLQIYLNQVETSHVFNLDDPVKRDKFMESLKNPFKFLEDADKEKNKIFEQETKNDQSCHVDIMTFNYTGTAERLMVTSLGNEETISHVHGQLGDTIVVGVDSKEQIENMGFRNNEDIIECFIKSMADSASKRLNEKMCEQLVTSANVVVLYGVSLGTTDDHWWKLIGDQLSNRNDFAVILHLYVREIGKTMRYKIKKYERENGPQLLDRFGLKYDDYKATLNNRFFFVYNSDVFNLD